MDRSWHVLTIAAATLALAACRGSGSTTSATTTAATTTLAPPVTTVVTTTSTPPRPTTTTTAPAPACQAIDVENPAIVALSATDGSPCWSALSGWNASAVGVSEGRLIVMGGPCGRQPASGTLAVLDARSGQELWRHEVPGDLDAAGSDAAGGDSPRRLGTGLGVVVPPTGGRVEALDLATGAVLWSLDGATAVADGTDTLIVSVGPPGSTTIAALDRRTGDQRWTTVTAGQDLGGVVADETVVVVGGVGPAQVYDAHTGAPLPSLPIGPASDTPAVRLVAGVATGVTGVEPDPNATRAFDALTGAPLWTSPGYPPQRPDPTDGNVYVIVDAGVAALDPRTGDVRWTVEGANLEAGPGLAITSPASAEATIEAIDPATGQVRWTKSLAEAGLPSSETVLASGAVVALQNVLPSSDGVFFAYGNCLGN